MAKEVYDLVAGGLRSIGASVPGFGGLVQAWSELDTHRYQERIDHLIETLMTLIKQHGDRLALLEKSTQTQEFAALLERTARKVIAEADGEKRNAYAVVLFGIATDAGGIRYDDGMDLIEALDSLTRRDLELLRRFGKGPIRVAELTQSSVNPMASPKELAPRIAPIIQSLSKLEARGLLGETDMTSDGYSWTGSTSHWVNRWRTKTMVALPFGLELLRLLEARAFEQRR